jgi:hypothetical protein
VTCGDEPFPASRLDGGGDAEMASDELGLALREFLAGDGALPYPGLPTHGWRILLQRADRVELAAPADAPGGVPWVAITFERQASGWMASRWGDCVPLAVLPGLGPARWSLLRAPAPTDTTIVILVSEVACHGSASEAARIAPPAVVETTSTVTITVGVLTLALAPGTAVTCPGTPPVPLTVRLSSPIGTRSVLDGNVYPAHAATVTNEPDPSPTL